MARAIIFPLIGYAPSCVELFRRQLTPGVGSGSLGLLLVSSMSAGRRVIENPAAARRSVVAVGEGWPLRRALRAVIVHTNRIEVRVTAATFLAPVMFAGLLASSSPTRDLIVWEDGETLNRDEDWTAFTLGCDTQGRALWLDLESGKAQIDWAEVVYENGETQVVDFNEKTRSPGLYLLLYFKDGRKVDHVRIVARARSEEARIVLRMQKL